VGQEASTSLPAIAVIGMAGRFPGARNVDEFWRNLSLGVESISFFSDDDLRRSGVDERCLADARYVKANGVLADIDLFDAEFFDFTPREAEITDPQHRLLLECAWEVLEDAGYDPDRFPGRIGVYAGAGISTYLLRNLIGSGTLPPGVGDLQILMGNSKDYVPTRISYKLNLKGPSINVNTACSTSLVAVHLACQALLDYHCDMALAGGVGIQVPQLQGYWYEDGGVGSPDGHCRAFDARAAGTVGGNGAGLVVLKRLADARNDRDCIRAIIRASSVNNDGHSKAGYTAPSVEGQAEVIAEALALAGVAPETIGYVEAHGTGTALGDPIELTALMQAFRSAGRRGQFCAIGSVKTNIGHLDEAAGVAGLIKTVLALERGSIPPSLHFEQPNPHIDFARSPFYVATRLLPWPAHTPRRAGVSSFGIGGTNAHVILEEAAPRPPSTTCRRWHVLPISATSPSALSAATFNLAGRFREEAADGCDGGEQAWLADAGYTLSIGRRAFRHRRVLVSSRLEEALKRLESNDSNAMFTSVSDGSARPVVFLFPGQGAQYPGMGWDLYRREPVFRRHLDACADILRTHLGADLPECLFRSADADLEQAAVELNRASYAQPFLFALEYALARVLMTWGIRPHAMIGHSLGEYVAACVAGVFSLEDALQIVAARGSLMEQLDAGRMMAVGLSEPELRPLLPDEVWVAGVNGPTLTMVSGTVHAVHVLYRRLADRGIGCHLLSTSHASHSPLVDPILPSLLDLMKGVRLQPPVLPYLSNVTGDWITSVQATDPAYWVAHSRQPVRFGGALEKVFGGTKPFLLEVGPGRNLASAVLRHSGRPLDQRVYTTLPHEHDLDPSDKVFLTTIARLWAEGVPVDWAAFYADEPRCRVPLPTHPFNRQRYWIDSTPQGASAEALRLRSASRALEKSADVAGWFYVPSWQRSMIPPAMEGCEAAGAGRWLLFIDDIGVGQRLAERLERSGAAVVTVSTGTRFERIATDRFVIDPGVPEHYRTTLTELTNAGWRPERIVHLRELMSAGRPASLAEELERGFYSLLFLAQAVRALLMDADVRIDVVSTGSHDILGDELLCPATAAALGIIKVIAQESPNITCRSIDIDLDVGGPPAPRDLIECLHDELTTGGTDGVVAYRGRHRWKPWFEPIRVGSTTSATSRLKTGGTYLITGGLGGVGTILAEYLAREFKARLVLVSRAGLPAEPPPPLAPAAESPELLSGTAIGRDPDRGFVLADRAGMIAAAADTFASRDDARLIGSYVGFASAANELCAAYVSEYFATSGLHDVRRGYVSPAADLVRRLRIQPPFTRFLDFFLRILCEESIVRIRDNGDVEFLRDLLPIGEAGSLRARIEREFPDLSGIIFLLDHCVRHYPTVLSGEVDGIDVLYPGGSSSVLEEAGRRTTIHSQRDVYITVLKDLIEGACRGSSGTPVRILEVGIGDGILTRAIAPILPPDKVEYWATDIGRTFVLRAEKAAAAAGLNFMKFAVFDIAAQPGPGGIEQGGFDFILALDVVHATPRIEESLTNLKRLLAPGGILALIETVGSHRWVDMTWGLANGWWSFEDRELRIDSPLLGLSQWESVLRRCGFEGVQTHPIDVRRRENADYGLILGQQPAPESARPSVSSWDPVTARRIRNVETLRELGADVLVLSADVGDEVQMQRAVAAVRRQFGPIDGVIHAAGVTEGDIVFNPLDDTTREGAETIFRSKVHGPVVLARVLGNETLDFCLLISSNAAILGGLGFAAYASASAFMDAFATAQSRNTGQRWISADWDGWPTEEMSAGTMRFQTSLDRLAMTRAECEQAFERALAQPSPHVVVSSADLAARLELWTSRPGGARPAPAVNADAQRSAAAAGEAGQPSLLPESSLHLRPEVSADYVAPVTATERSLCRIWQQLFAFDRIGIDDNFFELRGDSLLATQLIAMASREFDVRIPMRTIFERSTVASLAMFIDGLQATVTLLDAVPGHGVSEDDEKGIL
jgi:acyl transferase domain-containing protein/acyl carrier protein